MVQHAPGAQVKRIVSVRLLRFGAEGHFPELAAPAREIVGEEEGGAGMVETGTGPVDAAFAVQAGVVDAVKIGGQLAHLLPDFGWMAEIETGSQLHTKTRFHAAAQIANDVPIGAGVPHWFNGLPHALDATVGVSKRAIFLSEADGRQNHVGQLAGFVDEDVLANEQFQLFQSVAGVFLVGFAHHGVFADDEHAAHRAGNSAVHHFGGGEAGLGIKLDAPKLLEFAFDVRGGDVLVGGIDVGQAAAVGAALDVVLAAQRVESGAGFADVAAHHGQIGQGEGVVGAVGGLADAHAPVDGGAFGLGVEASSFTDAVGGYAGDRFSPFGGVCFQRFHVILKAFGAAADEVLVVEALFDDDVGHRLEDGNVGAGILAQPEGGEVGHANLARIDDDEFGPILAHGAFEEVGDDGVGLGGVGAGDDEGVQVFHFGDGVGHGAGTDG